MKELERYWDSFKDIAIVFSFAVNFTLVVLLLATSVPGLRAARALKGDLVEPLLNDLDTAFVGLGEASIQTEVQVHDSVPIEFGLHLEEKLPVSFELLIEQDIEVRLTGDVPLTKLPATFTFPGEGGEINGRVTLSLPEGQPLPIHLHMAVPVSETVPVNMTVPVKHEIPVTLTVPVNIELGAAGLGPAVEGLREVFHPLREQVESLSVP